MRVDVFIRVCHIGFGEIPQPQHLKHMRTYLTKAQRSDLIDRFMDSYTAWYQNEPDVYEQPLKRQAELESLSNSQLVAEIQDFI